MDIKNFSQQDYQFLMSKDALEDSAFLFPQRYMFFLLTAVENYRYKTRYYNAESYVQDDVDLMLDEIIERLLNPMDVCQVIADCLTNPDSPAHDALKEAIKQGGDAGTDAPQFGNPEGGDAGDRTLGESCDSDIAFGFVSQLVDLLHTSILDLFQLIEQGSNYAERLGILVDNVPFFSEITDFADQILEELQENYEASYNETIKNEYRCDLFCMMINNPNCVLKFSDMAGYFMGRAGGSLGNVNLATWVTDILGSPLSGDAIVHASHALLSGALAYGFDWLGLDVATLQKLCMAFMNDPDTDWTTLCDECPTCFDGLPVNFLPSNDCWESPKGEWIDGVGMTSEFNGDGTSTLDIYKNFTGIYDKESLSITWGNRAGSQGFFPETVLFYSDSTNSGNITDEPAGLFPSGGTITTTAENPYPARTITRIEIRMHGGSGNATEYKVVEVS